MPVRRKPHWSGDLFSEILQKTCPPSSLLASDSSEKMAVRSKGLLLGQLLLSFCCLLAPVVALELTVATTGGNHSSPYLYGFMFEVRCSLLRTFPPLVELGCAFGGLLISANGGGRLFGKEANG